MDKFYSKSILENNENDFSFKRKKSDLNIHFNRVAFIFFIFFIIYLIYTIHLLHLGSRGSDIIKNSSRDIVSPLFRATIVDINGNY